MKRYQSLFVGVLAFGIAVTAGRWGKALFTTSEFVHFSVNFPTRAGEPQLDLQRLGGPWARIKPDEWSGYPTGGLLVWGRENQLTVDIGKASWIKRLVQPGVLTVSSHWIRNLGTRPMRICLALDLCGFDARWETFEVNWDQTTKCATRAIAPGGTYNMDWIIELPAEARARQIVCDGDVRVINAETGRTLTEFPLSIVNSRVEATP